ncbi:PD40 domain-containing protein [Candidatus Uhrbacteria bacterium]|nr:PD40 domain-containing protein [Candidatus Uhrbacteria bacterium]
MDRKRFLAALGIVAFLLLAGAGLYFVFFRRAPTPEEPTAPPANLVPINTPALPPGASIRPPTPGTLLTPSAPTNAPTPAPSPTTPPVTAQGGRTQTTALSDTPTRFVRLATDGRPQYYDPSSQQFYRIGPDGRPVPLSDRKFPAVRSVSWSPNDDRAILEFPDGANVLFDFRANTQVTLPTHWEDFSFAPTGDRIAGKSVGLDRENRWLFEAGADGNNFRPIEPLGQNARKVTVAWSPNNSVVAFSRTGNEIGDERQQIIVVGRNGENFPGLTVEGSDFRPRWSPSGNHILYSAVHRSNDFKPELWVVGGSGDAIGSNRVRLHVNTWADKCTFGDETTLYCAVPKELPRGAGLEPSVTAGTPDTIERIDLTTGIQTTVGQPAEDTNITQLSVAPDGSRLFYTSRIDGRLYELRLR